jgi:hypothetical protein
LVNFKLLTVFKFKTRLKIGYKILLQKSRGEFIERDNIFANFSLILVVLDLLFYFNNFIQNSRQIMLPETSTIDKGSSINDATVLGWGQRSVTRQGDP